MMMINGWLLADVLLKSTGVLLVALVFNLLTPAAPAARRHLIWLISLVGIVLMPVLCATLPAWRILPPALTRGTSATNAGEVNAIDRTDIRTLIEARDDVIGQAAVARREAPVLSAVKARSSTHRTAIAIDSTRRATHRRARLELSRLTLLLLLWTLGCGALLVRVTVSWISLGRLARRSHRVAEGRPAQILADAMSDLSLRRRIVLLTFDERSMPMTWGIVRPKVLLPGQAIGWPVDRLRMALLHELAHVKRWDAAAQLLSQVACAIYWFHPLAWLAARRLVREQERAADDQVLGVWREPAEYAGFLLDVARLIQSRSHRMCGAIAMARPLALEGRLKAVLDASRRRHGISHRQAIIVLLAAVAALLPLASLHAQAPSPVPGPRAIGAPQTQPVSGTTMFTGHVVSPDGKPVVGAEIVLQANGDDSLARARSTADGSFSISAPIVPSEYNVAEAAIRAGNIGFASGRLMPGRDNVFRLTPSSSVRAVFLRPDGTPAAGIHVWAQRSVSGTAILPFQTGDGFRWIAYPPEWSRERPLQTDASGACVFPMLPRHSRTLVRVDATEFAQPLYDEGIQTGDDARSPPATVHLQLGGAISGKVVNHESGKGVAGIHVTATSRSPRLNASGQAITNARGEYRIEQLVPGNYVVRIYEPRSFPWTAAFRANASVSKGQTTRDQDLELVRGTLVTGRVIEADTGRGVAAVWVGSIDFATHEYPGAAISDAMGNYVLRLPPGREGIYLASQPPQGYSSAGFNGVNDAEIVIDAADGRNVSLDLKLTPKPGKPVAGRVLDPNSNPVAGANVQQVESDDDAIYNPVLVKTDANGNFQLRAIQPPAHLIAQIDDMGTLEPVAVQGGEQNVVLKLAPRFGVTIVGRVVDKRGKPFDNVGLYLSYGSTYEKRGITYGPSGQPTALTDADGRFRIPGLSPNYRYRLLIGAHGHGPSRTINIPIKPGEPVCDMGDIKEEN